MAYYECSGGSVRKCKVILKWLGFTVPGNTTAILMNVKIYNSSELLHQSTPNFSTSETVTYNFDVK